MKEIRHTPKTGNQPSLQSGDEPGWITWAGCTLFAVLCALGFLAF